MPHSNQPYTTIREEKVTGEKGAYQTDLHNLLTRHGLFHRE